MTERVKVLRENVIRCDKVVQEIAREIGRPHNLLGHFLIKRGVYCKINILYAERAIVRKVSKSMISANKIRNDSYLKLSDY